MSAQLYMSLNSSIVVTMPLSHLAIGLRLASPWTFIGGSRNVTHVRSRIVVFSTSGPAMAVDVSSPRAETHGIDDGREEKNEDYDGRYPGEGYHGGEELAGLVLPAEMKVRPDGCRDCGTDDIHCEYHEEEYRFEPYPRETFLLGPFRDGDRVEDRGEESEQRRGAELSNYRVIEVDALVQRITGWEVCRVPQPGGGESEQDKGSEDEEDVQTKTHRSDSLIQSEQRGSNTVCRSERKSR